jgi:formylglycine-generating enzyme required for sulfatase activity
MGADPADSLRALARDHLEGRSSLGDYRRLRAKLLDGLIAPVDRAAPEATRPRAAPEVSDATQPRAATPRATTDQAPPRPLPKEEGAGVGRAAGLAALGALLAGAIAFFVWHHARSPSTAPATTSSAAGASAESPDGRTDSTGQAAPIHALLEPLLENPDWSDGRLVALNESLLEAGQEPLDAARNTDWFNAFVASVRSRLRQQQALAGTPLTPDSSPLAALAVTLGIDLAASAQPPAQEGAAKQPGQGAGHTEVQSASHSGAQGASHTEAGGEAHTAAAPSGNSSVLAPAQGSGTAHAAPASPAPQSSAGSSAPLRVKSAQAEPARSPAITGSANTPATAGNAPAASAAHHEHPACSAALSQVRANYCQDFLASGDPAPLLAVIPRGSFMMGNSALAAEGPAHRVTLTYEFAMSVYEVSQSEFQLYCQSAGKACPEQPWARGDFPVVNVSWQDAQDYARWLSQATHQQYRLPTEAEWEYAARAGVEGLYPSGDSLSPTDAYFSVGAALTAPAPRSMRFNANGWHLLDMVGNAREWVADAWSPSFSGAPADGSARVEGEPGIKVVRGGCYVDPAIKLRLTTREPLPADTRDRCTGFRLVRDIR